MIRGLVAYPITPADDAGRVDVASLRGLVRRLIEAGVGRVCVLGSTGTYAYLRRDERRRAIEAAVDEVAGAALVMAGVGALRTDDAEALARDALAAGADVGLLAPVSYTPLTEGEVFEHFQRVAGLGLPICIYNNPVTTQFTFSADLVERLSAVPGIIGVKNPAPGPGEVGRQLADLRGRTPAGFSLGYSVDPNAATALLAGADAWHSVLGGLFPAAALAIARSAMAGETAEARQLSEAIAPFFSLAAELSSLRMIYAAATLLGLARAAPPRPILPLGAHDEARVRAALIAAGLAA